MTPPRSIAEYQLESVRFNCVHAPQGIEQALAKIYREVSNRQIFGRRSQDATGPETLSNGALSSISGRFPLSKALHIVVIADDPSAGL